MADKTVKVHSDGGPTYDYTSLNAALSGESGALPGILTIDCYNFQDTTQADTGTGYTGNDSTHYINIKAHDSHSGVWSTSAYRLISTSICLNVSEPYTIVDGLQINVSSISDQSALKFDADSDYSTIKNCIIKGSGSSSQENGIYSGGSENLIFNTIVFNIGTHGSSTGIYATAGSNIYNCTIISGVNAYGILSFGGAAVIKNCYVYASSGYAYDGSTLTTCASSDNTGTLGLRTIAVNTTNFTNVTGGSEDYHLPLGSALIDVGTDLSATFTTDIDGQTRPTGANTWDIGADEYTTGLISGTTCWGHATDAEITETNIRTFTGNGSGTATVTGSGDSEKLRFYPGQYWNFEMVDTDGEQSVTIDQNKYEVGDDVTLKYRTGATQAACEAASFSTYTGSPVTSLGIFQVRAERPS
jgi:hypothetical protein